MKLWLFNCTSTYRTIVSARVAAPTKDEAKALLRAAFGTENMVGIIDFFGEDSSIKEPAVLSRVEALA